MGCRGYRAVGGLGYTRNSLLFHDILAGMVAALLGTMSALAEVSQLSICFSALCRFLLSHQTEQKGKQPVPSQWPGDKDPGCNGSFSHDVQELCCFLAKVNILCTQAFKRGTTQSNL